jgi:hypothetical protein
VTKAAKAVVAAGVDVARVEVDKNGRIIVVAGKPTTLGGNNASSSLNPRDEVLHDVH